MGMHKARRRISGVGVFRKIWHNPVLAEDYDQPTDSKEHDENDELIEPNAWELSNCISSLASDGLHYLAVDIDQPCELIETSPGHYHLLVSGVGCKWDDYATMLEAMQAAGILQEGYVRCAIEREQSILRWGVRKPRLGESGDE